MVTTRTRTLFFLGLILEVARGFSIIEAGTVLSGTTVPGTTTQPPCSSLSNGPWTPDPFGKTGNSAVNAQCGLDFHSFGISSSGGLCSPKMINTGQFPAANDLVAWYPDKAAAMRNGDKIWHAKVEAATLQTNSQNVPNGCAFYCRQQNDPAARCIAYNRRKKTALEGVTKCYHEIELEGCLVYLTNDDTVKQPEAMYGFGVTFGKVPSMFTDDGPHYEWLQTQNRCCIRDLPQDST
ncbi:unnamed protein product [Amoebophrya sp. A25]|nr:unnamed protein product [Amoebophrya sp. A25]|eukprot:GSA25T00001251001.1